MKTRWLKALAAAAAVGATAAALRKLLSGRGGHPLEPATDQAGLLLRARIEAAFPAAPAAVPPEARQHAPAPAADTTVAAPPACEPAVAEAAPGPAAVEEAGEATPMGEVLTEGVPLPLLKQALAKARLLDGPAVEGPIEAAAEPVSGDLPEPGSAPSDVLAEAVADTLGDVPESPPEVVAEAVLGAVPDGAGTSAEAVVDAVSEALADAGGAIDPAACEAAILHAYEAAASRGRHGETFEVEGIGDVRLRELGAGGIEVTVPLELSRRQAGRVPRFEEGVLHVFMAREKGAWVVDTEAWD